MIQEKCWPLVKHFIMKPLPCFFTSSCSWFVLPFTLPVINLYIYLSYTSIFIFHIPVYLPFIITFSFLLIFSLILISIVLHAIFNCFFHTNHFLKSRFLCYTCIRFFIPAFFYLLLYAASSDILKLTLIALFLVFIHTNILNSELHSATGFPILSNDIHSNTW